MTWYRVHNDVLENPKLLMLAPSDRWYYIALLSLKSQGVLDKYDGDKLDRVICAKIRITSAEWDETARRLQEEELIDGKYQPVGWKVRQFESDSSTDRVRKYRERKKKSARNGNETLQKRKGNGGEAPQKRQRNRNEAPPDTDTDTDTYKNIPVAAATAAGAALAVDNFSLPDLKAIYSNPDSETEILNHGVPLLTRSGVEFGAARNFLQMLINKHGAGKALDALIVSLIEQPTEPKSYLQAVLAKLGNPISKDWVPPGPCLSELGALAVPDDVIEKARDAFVMWFWEQGIRHTNFPALFVRWCERDWERAEGNKNLYLRRLRASAGFEEPFREPA